MPKRDRQPEHWGSLVPHNSMHGRRPVPLSRPTVVIGKGGDVRAPSNPHLSRHHIRLEREGDGSVYATHLSALNSTWLNGKRLEHDRRTLVEPCAGNAPYSLTGEAPDAPLLFVSVPNAASARAACEERKLNGWCGWSLRLERAGDCVAAPAGASAAPSAEPQRGGALVLWSRGGGDAAAAETEKPAAAAQSWAVAATVAATAAAENSEEAEAEAAAAAAADATATAKAEAAEAAAADAAAMEEAEVEAAEAEAAAEPEPEWGSEERRAKETIFRGVRLLLAARLGDKLRELQEEVVRRGGGEVVSDVREATHLALESDRRPSELACLAALPEAEWPRLVTKDWVGQCSKVLSADGSRTDVLRKNLHPSAVAAAREPASPEASVGPEPGGASPTRPSCNLCQWVGGGGGGPAAAQGLAGPSALSEPPASDAFFVRDPPSPPPELKRAKEEARAKAKKGKAARTHQHQQSWGPREMNASKHRCLLAETYEKEEDDERLAEEVWIATEKFDGVRMRWEGHKRGFTGRNGQGHFQPPDSFKALLPEEHLDGELWAGRCRFSAVGSLQGTKGLGRRLHEMAWHSLTYVVFDAPQVAGPYMQRLEAARRALAAVGPPDGRIVVAPAVRVADATAKDALLQRVIAKRGEGLVLRRDEAWWRRNVLKVKQWLDAEAVIVGHKNAHTTGNLPTVLVRALNAPNASPSIEFELSVERPSPEALKQRTLLEDLQLRFPVDTIVTFVYRQISKGSGAPTIPGGAPKIMRVHPFDCDCCVCRPEGDDTT
ncbi:hypothetical protein EMIHUDRAFT_109212 [Emiliania huxleyi CCMP1516]|uniref:Uncharacterized protein n=2 Tax=Emiliania huxleyi TaxID=2903 RepID=A0A0D3KSR0_EMIH1|nr:hypothetical protein EMIHUDRAFT_109212 [Emiliania huxleyi CCMP1516]EOD38795.1 hypothetical protein EMIHUDRAFT_109212 [Emiliania huxleyi CCMP1516]|eukprot:XP_005791224.1 hypothetical protein EMIHUDRAFT_109212 [Emiliania huxleyi CCMP1516]